MSVVKYNFGKTSILAGDIDLRDDTLKVLLVNSSYTPSGSHNYVSQSEHNLNACELTGTGYSRQVLVGKVFTTDHPNNLGYMIADNTIWQAINAGTAAGAVIYKDTGADSTSPLIVYIDSGGFPMTTAGGDLTIYWSTSGIVQFS